MQSSRFPLALTALLLLAGAASTQSTHSVSTTNTKFTPKHLNLPSGDSVQWIWTGGNTHTATEGTDTSIDPTDAFSYILDQFFPSWTHVFDNKFLFENPRPGHFYPYLCVPHAAFGMTGTITVQSPWSNRGFAKGGALGNPLLYGEGSMVAGTPAEVLMENAPPLAIAALFVGAVESGVPFKGGTLVPVPILLQIDLVTDASGGITLPFLTPNGVGGLAIYMQCAMLDVTATNNVALSNVAKAEFQ
ncbi:MAG: plastocyanin [Pseudohongiellaceae bacterium]|jgi:plastocyanin